MEHKLKKTETHKCCVEDLCKMSLRGPKGRGNLLNKRQKKPSLCLRLLRSARNDNLRPDVFYNLLSDAMNHRKRHPVISKVRI